jgi:hypothetical protein
MTAQSRTPLIRHALFWNGVVDLLSAAALFFPLLGLPLPGYGAYTPELTFVAGGWGIAALCFGIGRIWASFKPDFHRMMGILGLTEGAILTVYCLASTLFLGLSLLQVLLPLAVASVFGVLYAVALVRPSPAGKVG